jgi:hypothetical protein
MTIEKKLGKVEKKNMYILPSVFARHSAKCLFAECLWRGTRQRLTPLIAWRLFAECRRLPSARHSAKNALPSVFICRVPGARQRLFSPCVFLCRA